MSDSGTTAVPDARWQWLVARHLIHSAIVGSRAYGLATEASDIDRRGVFAAPAPLYWRLDAPPNHVDGPADEQVSWELAHFCSLGLGGNPTVLETLWSPLVEVQTEVGRELCALRSAFLSIRLADTYGRYAHDQWTRLENRRRRTGEVTGKQAMHLLRLLLCGLHVVRTGEVLVDVSDQRDRLLAVRRGECTFDDLTRWTQRLIAELEAAVPRSALPAAPRRREVEDLLIRVRRASVDDHDTKHAHDTEHAHATDHTEDSDDSDGERI